jgi:hypothetical protein
VPKEITFKTKPAIALKQLRWACVAGLPRGVVLMDAGYGAYTDLRTNITALGDGRRTGCGGTTPPARVVLSYLAAVQESDGRWPQNMWLDGTAYWGGVQLDECAFPILLVDLLLREKMLEPSDADRFTEMVFAAAGFIVRNGPATRQDLGRKTRVIRHLRSA